MNKIQEAFEKKYLVSAFSQKEIDLFMKTFTAGYKAKEAETCEWTWNNSIGAWKNSCSDQGDNI